MNQLEEFTRIRRILFAVFNKSNQGQINAFEYLEGYKKKLGQRSYTGLKAELGFFQKYRKEFRLTPALDSGDHVTEISNAQEYERDRMEYQQSMGQNPVFDITRC